MISLPQTGFICECPPEGFHHCGSMAAHKHPILTHRHVRACFDTRAWRKVIHLKLFSVHSDDVSFGVSGHRLLMQHLNMSFDDLILSLLIRRDQVINVPKDMWKIVQVEQNKLQTMANTAGIQLFSPLFFHLKTRAVTPPVRAAMPTSNRKHASGKTPLLPLAISNTVTKSVIVRNILPAPGGWK